MRRRSWIESSQANPAIVPIHQCRGGQADRQIDRHDDRDAFDGLAGLIDRRIHDGHQIGIADRYRKRAVLRAVQILAGQRRYDQAQRLRQDNKAHRLATVMPEGMGCLVLARVHGEDAGADDFRDEGCGVER